MTPTHPNKSTKKRDWHKTSKASAGLKLGKNQPRPTVFVAMSGGVDSSVAAALLKKQGYEVVGVFMKNWDEMIDGINYCSTEADFRDMRAVCQFLDIPYYTFNFEQAYKEQVLKHFFQEYKAGRTPNPDVMCNKEIKFGLFLQKAIKLGADFVATGHHIRKQSFANELKIKNNKLIIKTQISHNLIPDTAHLTHLLLKGVDSVKDQTYFVYNLDQKQLSKCLFPIGEYTKPQIRALAKKLNLPTATKPDSQGICFLGPVDVKTFLKTVIKPKKGKIVNLNGEILGEHEGAWFYTIGQRRIAGLSGQTTPLYVVDTDIKKNLVVVGTDADTYAAGAVLENMHWINHNDPVSHPEFTKSRASRGISGSQNQMPKLSEPEAHPSRRRVRPDKSSRLTAKPRYGPEVYAGRLSKKRHWEFIFDEPQRAITAGQSLVVYDKDKCLGGGVIREAIATAVLVPTGRDSTRHSKPIATSQ